MIAINQKDNLFFIAESIDPSGLGDNWEIVSAEVFNEMRSGGFDPDESSIHKVIHVAEPEKVNALEAIAAEHESAISRHESALSEACKRLGIELK